MHLKLAMVFAISAGACSAAAPRSASQVAVATGAGEPLVQRVAGCYVLRGGPWEENRQLGIFFPVESIPRRIRLTAERLTGWDALQSDTLPLYAVEAEVTAAESRWVFTYWGGVRKNSDSLRIGAPLSMGGANLRVYPAGDQLVGTITTFTDAIPPDGVAHAEAPIVLDRVVCSASR
jgi:hypothetical protein